MIQIVMYVALGFLLASLLSLVLLRVFWLRAVALTERRLRATAPLTAAEIQAEKDAMRAEFAVELRRCEMALAKAKESAVRHLVERNKRQARIDAMQTEMQALRTALEERSNEMRVVEQTVRKRFPELEQQLDKARSIIAAQQSELARLKSALDNQREAFERENELARRRAVEIERLRRALEGDDTGITKRLRSANAEAQAMIARNQALEAELSRVREELDTLKSEAQRDNDLLKLEIRRLADHILQTAAERKAAARQAAEIAAAAAALGDDEGQEEAGSALVPIDGGGDLEPQGEDDESSEERELRRIKRPVRKPPRRRRAATRAAAAPESSLKKRLESLANTDG